MPVGSQLWLKEQWNTPRTVIFFLMEIWQRIKELYESLKFRFQEAFLETWVCMSWCHSVTTLHIHSKHTRVSVTRKRVHWGQTLFRVTDAPEISQLDAKYDLELSQSDPMHYLSIWLFSSLTRNVRSLAPMDHFRVTADPGVFRVYESGCWNCVVLL